jgi:hypothetical protein
MGVQPLIVLMHIKRADGTLTPNVPGMHISGHSALDAGGVQDLSA